MPVHSSQSIQKRAVEGQRSRGPISDLADGKGEQSAGAESRRSHGGIDLADRVFGQATFTSGQCGPLDATGLCDPYGGGLAFSVRAVFAGMSCQKS